VARTSESYSSVTPSRSTESTNTRRRSVSTPVTSPRITVVFDQDNLGIGLSERLGGGQAAEAAPHDHDAGW
jgi:hypothetical protein